MWKTGDVGDIRQQSACRTILGGRCWAGAGMALILRADPRLPDDGAQANHRTVARM